MKYKLKALSLSVVIALLFLLSACDYALSPPAEPTPNLQPTIDALVDQRLAEKEKEAAKKAKDTETLSVALVPTPTQVKPTIDEEAAIRAVSEYIEPYSASSSYTFGAQYLGGNNWTVQTYGWRFFPDRGTNELIIVHWGVYGNAPPIVLPKDDAEEWDAFLRGRPELVDWVQLTWCLIREDSSLIDEWNELTSPRTDAQISEFRGRKKSIRDRLWQADTPRLGREIRDKLIRSWDKFIAYNAALLSGDSNTAQLGELLSESNLLRGQAVESILDLKQTYRLWEMWDKCPY